MNVHLWNAYNPKKISVEIRQNLKDKLKEFIRNNLKKYAMKMNIQPTRLYEYFIWQKALIPLNVLMTLSKLAGISLIDMEKEIIQYKHLFVPNKNSVKKPNLPIKICPYFTSIISHLYFDGSVPKDGKGTYYNQKDRAIMQDFVDKVKFVFGDVQYSIVKDHRGILKCRVPRIIGEICKSVYGIDSFGTFDSRISNKIFRLPKEHKIAFILSAILDEGSITYDGDIQFGVSNKRLCADVQQLCSEIGLNPGAIKQKKNNEHYYFYIKDRERLLSFLNLFKIKYSLINIGFKEDRIRHFFKLKKFPGRNTKEAANGRRTKILQSLAEKEKTVNELCLELLIPPRSLRRHLSILVNKDNLSKKKRSIEYVYSLE